MKIRLDCDSSFSRPVVNLDKIFPGCQALIDTGALFPVWTASEESLKALGAQPDPKLQKGEITGFGGSAKGNLYRLTIELNGIYYIELPIIASRLPMSRFHIVLPSTMFSDMELVIDYRSHRVDIDTRSNQVSYHMHHKNSDDGTLVLING
jgi:hypothetical protein